jgi:hypothetical protein
MFRFRNWSDILITSSASAASYTSVSVAVAGAVLDRAADEAMLDRAVPERAGLEGTVPG